MTEFKALREISGEQTFKKGDYFILFGELFGRGYANGLVEQAKAAGMKIIGATVGRREKEVLRPLNQEELQTAEDLLGGKIINIPLEAGFDLDCPEGSSESMVSKMAGLKLDTWEKFAFDEDFLSRCREEGIRRLVYNLRQFFEELQGMIEPGANILFAHTMAGGFPRAKILFALANRIFKGRGDRYLNSGKFWNHSIGQFVAKNFMEVTANTLAHLIQGSQPIREKTEKAGGKVYYTAYGYHGTEIIVDDEYKWQTYTPYQQGYAKKELENIATLHRSKGINVTVFNCPEIRTNSSDIFAGVELSLFPLLKSLKRENKDGNAWVKKQWEICESKLNADCTIDSILEDINFYLTDSLLKNFFNYKDWPMANTKELSELMVGTSEKMIKYHKNPKDLISDYLSSLVLQSVGHIIFQHIGHSKDAVLWLGHDIVARKLLEIN